MVLRYRLTPEEYFEGQSAYRTRMTSRRFLFRNLYLLALLCGVVATFFWLSGDKWLAALFYAACIVLFFERWLFWRLRAQKANSGMVRANEEVELTVSDESLTWNTASSRGDTRLANLLACHETANLVLLQLSAEDVLPIPKRAFAGGDYSRLKDLLRNDFDLRTTRESGDSLLLKFAVSWALGAVLLLTLGLGFVDNFLTSLPKRPVTRQSPRANPMRSPAASVEHLRGKGIIYLVPIGEIQSIPSITDLREHYQYRYHVAVNLLPEIPLPQWALNSIRKQYVAEDLIEAMQLAYPKIVADPDSILVGLTASDIYISGVGWNYAFSYRSEERFAVISTAHLAEDEDGKAEGGDVLAKRLPKVLTRDLGILYFRLQPSHDYRSVLYQYVDGADELDDVGDDYLESDALVRADLHVQDGDPCFIVRQYTQPARSHPELGMLSGCTGSYKERDLETVQVDLRFGLLLDQRTDFLIQDKIPLELTRVLRTQDDRARAFGVGGTHNLNIFLVGDKWPFTWMDLVLAHGGRAHFKRSNWGVGYWDALYKSRDMNRSEFSTATIKWGWPGWKLSKGFEIDRFPDGANAHAPEQAALISIEHMNGEKLSLGRNDAGELLRAVSPERHELVFTYDASHRIRKVQDRDRSSNQFLYDYDAKGRLVRVTDSEGRVTEYGYDSWGRLNSIQRDGVTHCTFKYGSRDRVEQEAMADGRVYTFEYQIGRDGKVYAADILDSAGPTRRVRMSGIDYSVDTVQTSPR
jgi:YD repeat-containing protein